MLFGFSGHLCSVAQDFASQVTDLVQVEEEEQKGQEGEAHQVPNQVDAALRKIFCLELFLFSETEARVVICRCGHKYTLTETNSTTTMADHLKLCRTCAEPSFKKVSTNEKKPKQSTLSFHSSSVLPILRRNYEHIC